MRRKHHSRTRKRLLSSSSNLGLFGTPNFLHPVLSALLLFSGSLCSGLQNTLSPQPEFGFEFLCLIHAIVDKCESGGFSTTEVGSESKSENSVSGALVHLGQFFTNFSLWD